MKTCRNCETALDGHYCPNCGQKDIDLERPIGELIHELLVETVDLDGRAFRTLKILFLRPGALTSEFLDGKRRTYTPPLRLYLVISVLFFVLAGWIAGKGMLLDAGQSIELDASNQARFLAEDLPRLMFAMLPLFAVMMKVVIPKRLFFDHVIFSIHLHSAAFVVLAVMLPLEEVALWFAYLTQVPLLFYLLAYFVISAHRVYQETWIMATIKVLAVSLVYLSVISGVIETASTFELLSD